MKITFDTEKGTCKVGGKDFNGDLKHYKKNEAISFLRKFIRDNTELTDYDADSMWMSYRYCIGRHSIASHMRAGDIAKECYGRMSRDRSNFNAYDINKEIEDKLRYGHNFPEFHFPITPVNGIYTTAVDIVCEFIEDYGIKSKEELLKYKTVNVILTDNERGYKVETETWEEYLRPRVRDIVANYYDNEAMSEEFAWEYFETWRSNKELKETEITKAFEDLTKNMPNIEYCYMHDFEDLFVWNDLCHLFDLEHHHKSILIDGSECEWFWSWTEKSEEHDDGFYYKAFGYKKIRVPVDAWNGSTTVWIPDESISKDIS